MEPLAPGTEDEVHQTPVVSKKTSEQERLLSIKAVLPNGQYDNVFELTYNNGAENWYCRICKCPIMGRVFYHEGGKRHSINMANAQKKNSRGLTQGRGGGGEQDATNIKVAPGEPVPPGFEGEISKVAQIQERLDAFHSGSLLGLEYLLEIQDYDHEKEPSYLCILCGKKGDPRTVIAHLVSYNHIQSYLQRHFPKTYQALAPYATRQYKKNWQDTMTKIAEAIETKYGRLLPHPVDVETFDKKRDDIYHVVHVGPHFSEKNGVTFEDLVVKEEMTKLSDINDESVKVKKRSPSPPVVHKPKKPKPATAVGRRRSLSSVSSISSSDLSDFDDRKEKRSNIVPKNRYWDRRQRSRSPYHFKSSRYERRSPSPRRRYESNMPWNRPDYIRSKSTSSERNRKEREFKMEEFKRLSQAIENDMEKIHKQHQLNPEKHPQYNDEWKVFWNKRYKELQAEGKDASKYDFKPEWIVYWNDKIEELHKVAVKTRIDALKRRLGITSSEPAPISFKIEGKKKLTLDTKPTPVASQPDQDHEVIVIEDLEDSPSPKRSHSPWEPEMASSRKQADRLSLDRVSSSEKELEPYRNRSKEREREQRRYEHDRYSRSSRDRRSSSREYYREDYRARDRSWDRDIKHHREMRKDPLLDMYKPPPVMRDVTRNPVDYTRMNSTASPEVEDDGEINIVAVLRLLTALEDQLGSLGPKVIDMLATALAMEKKEANSSETLLDNEINCVLFETIKEKLKGALHAGLVGYNQEKAFKIAIKKIASLLHVAGTRKDDLKTKAASVDPVKVPGVGTVDKTAIAKQIATALVLQGKTDVTHAELEQLINAVVGMAEAKQKTNQPVTTASFLESLTKKTDDEHKTEEKSDAPSTSTSSEFSQTRQDNSMDGLSDSDLQTLLQNFKDLSSEEQHGLITYLKKLEAKEPERVEKLRKFVNLDTESDNNPGKCSPFTRKLNNAEIQPVAATTYFDDNEEDEFEKAKPSKQQEDSKAIKIRIESDEEEYTYEDVFKAANKNVEESKQKAAAIEEMTTQKEKVDVLSDAKNLIANIMGSFKSSNNRSINPLEQGDKVPLQTNSFNDVKQQPPNVSNQFDMGHVSSLQFSNNQPPQQQPPNVSYPIKRSYDNSYPYNNQYNNRFNPRNQYNNRGNYSNNRW